MDRQALAVFMVFGCPTLVLLAALLVRYLAAQMRHRERLAAIEKGVDLAALSLPDSFPLDTWRLYLLRGLIWLLSGLAIALCLLVLTPSLFDGPRTAALLGFIPAGVGLAYLIFYWTEGQRAEEEKAGDA